VDGIPRSKQLTKDIILPLHERLDLVEEEPPEYGSPELYHNLIEANITRTKALKWQDPFVGWSVRVLDFPVEVSKAVLEATMQQESKLMLDTMITSPQQIERIIQLLRNLAFFIPLPPTPSVLNSFRQS